MKTLHEYYYMDNNIVEILEYWEPHDIIYVVEDIYVVEETTVCSTNLNVVEETTVCSTNCSSSSSSSSSCSCSSSSPPSAAAAAVTSTDYITQTPDRPPHVAALLVVTQLRNGTPILRPKAALKPGTPFFEINMIETNICFIFS